MTSRGVALALILASLLGACAKSSTDERTFDLFEYEIVGPAQLADAVESVAATNSGEFPHSLVVTDKSGVVVAATSLIDPGEAAELVLDLQPGQYSVTCRIVVERPDGGISDHYEQGMSASVTVVG